MAALRFLLLLVGLLGACGQAEAACKLFTLVELPVTMAGSRALVSAKINGTDSVFILDSGSVVSMISPANAARLHLPLSASSLDMELEGVGGTFKTVTRRVETLTLNGLDFKNVPFVVGGTDVEKPAVGLIGQNVLRMADVDYDLADHAVRLMRPEGCQGVPLAYWGDGKPVAVLPIESTDDDRRHTVATVLLNGVAVRALFDTGAANTIMSLRTAARLGLRPNTPGVTAAGEVGGLGRATAPAWSAPLDTFQIGDEKIMKTRLLMGETGPDIEMLVGLDFFRAHRIFVSSSQNRMYLTYTGGPVFNAEADKTPAKLSAASPG